MTKKELFIYKLMTNKDWFLLFNYGELSLPYPTIDCFETFNDELIEYLGNFPSEDDFEVFKSSISVKDKLIHYINSYYCSGYGECLFLINDKDEVYCFMDSRINSDIIKPLSNDETNSVLNAIISEFDLETKFNEIQKDYLEHNEEMIEEFEKIKTLYASQGLLPLYDGSNHYGSLLKDKKI